MQKEKEVKVAMTRIVMATKSKLLRETTGKRRKHNIIVRTTKDKNSSQGYIGKGITPSFALSVKDLNTGEKLNIFL